MSDSLFYSILLLIMLAPLALAVGYSGLYVITYVLASLLLTIMHLFELVLGLFLSKKEDE